MDRAFRALRVQRALIQARPCRIQQRISIFRGICMIVPARREFREFREIVPNCSDGWSGGGGGWKKGPPLPLRPRLPARNVEDAPRHSSFSFPPSDGGWKLRANVASSR